ncbi:hypothetical protein ACWNPI_00875 [Limosilactobacillus fermentum]
MAKPRATRALWFSLPVCGRALAVVEEAGVLDVAFLVVAGVATTALVTVVVEALEATLEVAVAALAAELVAEEAAEPALDAVEEAEDAALESVEEAEDAALEAELVTEEAAESALDAVEEAEDTALESVEEAEDAALEAELVAEEAAEPALDAVEEAEDAALESVEEAEDAALEAELVTEEAAEPALDAVEEAELAGAWGLKVDFSTIKPQATASSSSSSAASSASSASASAASSSSSSAKSATASSSATSSSTQASSTKASSNTSTTQPSSATNTDNAETRVLSIMKSSDPTQQSASAGFFAKQVTIKQDGSDYLITFTLSSGNGYIKSMTLNGEQPTATTANGDTGTYTYKVSAAVLAKGSATLAFALQTPLGAMNETALAVFPGTGKSTSDVVNDAAKTTTDEPVTLTSNGSVIDTTKEVQDVEYEVLNAAKSGVSEANAYYTHTARVTKSGSGYNVTLTVKVKSGIVSFTPLSVGAGPIVNTTKTSSGGDDIWTYTFYVADPTVLDNPVAASIRMSVPIANISNQTFSIWLVFGKTATNTSSYLDTLSGDGTSGGTLTSTGLTGSGSATPLAGSASPMATALQSGTGTVQNFDLAAAQKKLGKYAVKPGVSKMVEASLIKYPIAAALTFFIVAALIVIGVATTWRQRIVKKVRGLIHEA